MAKEWERLKAALADRYPLERELGHGGMATVYVAHDLKHDRPVALKVLKPELALALGPERFLREIRFTAQLEHPHILPLLDSGEADGFLYYVMPYVEGESLRDRLHREKQLSLDDACQISREVADALSYAHSRGIVHRDIKPENILLGGQHARVADFGIARAVTVAGGETLTTTGLAIGTPAYMSPEQAGREKDIDGRSDVYALGCVLYEMLAGHPPFTGETAHEILARHSMDAVPSLAAARPTVPPHLERAVATALAKTPADRFSTAAQFAQALARPESASAAGREPVPPASRRSWRLALLGLVVVTLVGGALLTVGPGRKAPMPGASAYEAIGSLAVLPFANAGGDAEMDYLSDGITDNLINRFSQLPGLRVVPRTTVFRYKGREVAAERVGRDLNVRAVLMGRVLSRRDSLFIGAELIDATREAQLWGGQYNQRVGDIFAIQAQIAKEIADRLRVNLTGGAASPLTKSGTRNLEAYHLYLKGRYHWRKFSKEGYYEAVKYFDQAIAIDPSYALAYVGLSDAYGSLGYLALARPRDVWPKAVAAALKALELDEGLAEAHAALAHAVLNYDWDWPRAKRELDRSIELSPDYPVARHWYSHYWWAVGKEEESLADSKRAVELDPLDLILNAHLLYGYYFADQYGPLTEYSQKVREIDPNFFAVYLALGVVSEERGLFDEAIAQFRKAVAVSGRAPIALVSLGHGYAVAGRKHDAQAVIAELDGLSRQGGYNLPYYIAVICAGLGEHDRAFEWLETAYQEHDPQLLWLKVDPRLDRLQADARFADLTRRVGLP